jgi:hypothetical protein
MTAAMIPAPGLPLLNASPTAARDHRENRRESWGEDDLSESEIGGDSVVALGYGPLRTALCFLTGRTLPGV